MSALEFANARMNFNDFRPEGAPNGYAQQNQTPTNVSDAGRHFAFEHGSGGGGMAQNQPIKTEGLEASSYAVSSLPGVDGISNAQDGSLWRNGSFNSEPHLMNSSTAGGPYQPKSAGVLTGTF